MDDQIVQQNAAEAPRGPTAQQLAEHVLGKGIRWTDNRSGFCKCPGDDRHTTKNGTRDCIVYLEPVPTAFCLHQSCSREIEEANQELRKAFTAAGLDGGWARLPDRELKRALAKIDRAELIRLRAIQGREKILKRKWTYAEMVEDSPSTLSADPSADWKFVVSLFPDKGCIWIGDKFDSGKPEHAKHFRCKSDWLKEVKVPGPFTCPTLFGVGTHSRSNGNVLRRPFLVVESDELGKDEVGSVFRWLKDDLRLNLRCIVDTAGKSLHGWFDCPDEESLEELKLILPQWACDPRMFTPSQPCRMAGALRDGHYQKLVYLGKEGR